MLNKSLLLSLQPHGAQPDTGHVPTTTPSVSPGDIASSVVPSLWNGGGEPENLDALDDYDEEAEGGSQASHAASQGSAAALPGLSV